jgi:hypothetical protein
VSVWADRESSLSLRGRTFTFIPRTVQPLGCIMSRYQAGSVIYGLATVIQLQRIARPIPVIWRMMMSSFVFTSTNCCFTGILPFYPKSVSVKTDLQISVFLLQEGAQHINHRYTFHRGFTFNRSV